MLYHTTDYYLSNLFAATRPNVDLAIRAMEDTTKQFLGHDLAIAYLCQGMSTQSFFNNKFDDNKRARLDYYLSGKVRNPLTGHVRPQTEKPS